MLQETLQVSFEELCGILLREELGSGLKMHSPYTTLPDKREEVSYFDKAAKNPKRATSDTAPLKRKKKNKKKNVNCVTCVCLFHLVLASLH